MIELRAFEPADAATIVSWIDGLDTLVTWSGSVGFTWPFDAGQLLGFQAANPTRRFLVAADAAGSPVGSLTLRPDSDHSVRLGLVLVSPAARGRGHGRAMVEAALGTAFADPGVPRVTLGVFAHNGGARRLYERLGFRQESVDERVTQVGDQWWSLVSMSLSRETWRGE
ncbi:GNAT family protein [Nonomuraea antimicrobica]|uniref:GNAT family protein n=1 Tax=Nonomuraea antimicrobica TaxID=561173 RepID=A0ABP7C7T0_9ACTN